MKAQRDQVTAQGYIVLQMQLESRTLASDSRAPSLFSTDELRAVR